MQCSLARLLASAAVTAILAAGLGGCQTMSDITGSITSKAEADPGGDPRSSVDVYGERYRGNPKDAEAALAYGQSLRATGQRAQAVAVFEQATIAHPGNKALLAGYGRALADNGNFQQAFDVLPRAHSPDNPDWRILSVQGTALDQLGRHDEARRYYASALKIAPEEPSVLSNLGLSYVLSKDLPKAEETLRRAYASTKADARVRQNLGLVVGLQGRFAEAEEIGKKVLERDPKNTMALSALAQVAATQKDDARAIGYLTRVLQLYPGNTQARATLVNYKVDVDKIVPSLELSAKGVAPYVGEYRFKDGLVKVAYEKDKLMGTSPAGKCELRALTQTKFYCVDADVELKFNKDSRGRVAGVTAEYPDHIDEYTKVK